MYWKVKVNCLFFSYSHGKRFVGSFHHSYAIPGYHWVQIRSGVVNTPANACSIGNYRGVIDRRLKTYRRVIVLKCQQRSHCEVSTDQPEHTIPRCRRCFVKSLSLLSHNNQLMLITDIHLRVTRRFLQLSHICVQSRTCFGVHQGCWLHATAHKHCTRAGNMSKRLFQEHSNQNSSEHSTQRMRKSWR